MHRCRRSRLKPEHVPMWRTRQKVGLHEKCWEEWESLVAWYREIVPGGWKKEKEKKRNSMDVHLNYGIQFTSAWLMESGSVPWCPSSKPGWRHSFEKEVHPLLCISKTIHLKLGHSSNRGKDTDIPLDNLYLCNRLAPSRFAHIRWEPISSTPQSEFTSRAH